jgi:hypothetical protein
MERSLKVKALPMVVSILASGLVSAQASAAAPKEPPMNDFDFAFYTCAGGDAFQVSYDSETPTKATLTTNNGGKRYQLERKPADQGVEFAKSGVRFWTDGKTVVFEGTTARYRDCKLKSG